MAYKHTRDRRQPGAYHVFNRARDGLWLFRDDDDRRHFENLIDRHISSKPRVDRRGRPYAWLREEVRMNARCLMYTHFHLILWQRVPGGIDRLMRRVIATYTRYYNNKYGTSHALFEGEYRARRLQSPSEFRWCVGYVHDNHKSEGLIWPFSTHRFYLDPDDAPSALEVGPALRLFGGTDGYRRYMAERAERQALDRKLRTDDRLFKP